jgi:hypothetical protein
MAPVVAEAPVDVVGCLVVWANAVVDKAAVIMVAASKLSVLRMRFLLLYKPGSGIPVSDPMNSPRDSCVMLERFGSG